MSSTFGGDCGWFYYAQRELKSDLDLGLISKEQYEESMDTLWNEKQEDSLY
jgi:hypothetical protein